MKNHKTSAKSEKNGQTNSQKIIKKATKNAKIGQQFETVSQDNNKLAKNR